MAHLRDDIRYQVDPSKTAGDFIAGRADLAGLGGPIRLDAMGHLSGAVVSELEICSCAVRRKVCAESSSRLGGRWEHPDVAF
jgi:hypothetical protein